MYILKFYIFLFFLNFICFYSLPIYAQPNTVINVGGRLFITKWVQKDDGFQDFESKYGGQISLNLGIQKGKYYAGYSLNTGKYNVSYEETYTNPEFTATLKTNKIKRLETDLIIGYYFWKNISLFLDYKTIDNNIDFEYIEKDTLTNSTYHETATNLLPFRGLGFGISSNLSVSTKWSLFGTLGFIPYGNKLTKTTGISRSNSLAFEFGAVYGFTKINSISFGLRIHKQKYWFDDLLPPLSNQLTGFFIGYNYQIY